MPAKVAINGFGRIGRNVLRAALESRDIEILAVNDLTDPATLAHLLKYDSVHGILQAEVSSGEGIIRVNDREIKVCSATDPAELPWKELGIDIVIESTGRFTKGSDAARHLQAGAERVVISAPGKEVDATFCMGVNEQDYDPARHRIVSNASCTTNCLAPVAKVLNEQFGIRRGMMTTIHSYTNDQKILDLPHKDLRRARAAAMSMIPTTTGAAKAVALVLPEMEGKLTGMAVRVPTPNVSLVDLVVETERATSVAEVNEVMRQAAAGPLKGILDYNELPLVSHDLNGSSASSTIDALSTNVLDGNMVKVLSWYDNEWGYSNRVLDLVKFIAAR
ncbi:type I glyceraldehyde-3-phosphate dehydrogenase [Geothermobacter hydrogeniphilus]|uniref:Glyceraldehyde-3-phosphate dehydrogenase n=1 Tax=Geothermobacter hydrogeniphilus TaxID=1969733 RepID=A0A1X0XLD0_9BACT|nr:type I glyceraldehyde-3-phosphate dehydrogenase [Geothermobacter hydrogeniphilus]ORJ53709.1 type I glyceraldehyde-3-phosphate dehydrogenase [Geothermobacter hydrogeniphilus]